MLFRHKTYQHDPQSLLINLITIIRHCSSCIILCRTNSSTCHLMGSFLGCTRDLPIRASFSFLTMSKSSFSGCLVLTGKMACLRELPLVITHSCISGGRRSVMMERSLPSFSAGDSGQVCCRSRCVPTKAIFGISSAPVLAASEWRASRL